MQILKKLQTFYSFTEGHWHLAFNADSLQKVVKRFAKRAVPVFDVPKTTA